MERLIEIIREEKEKETHRQYPALNKTNIDYAIGYFQSEVKNGEKKYTSSEILELLKMLKY